MEIQQETMGFDNGNSEEEAISNMTEDQCQQAISKLEYYAVKFEKYVEALRKLEGYRRPHSELEDNQKGFLNGCTIIIWMISAMKIIFSMRLLNVSGYRMRKY